MRHSIFCVEGICSQLQRTQQTINPHSKTIITKEVQGHTRIVTYSVSPYKSF